MMTDMPLGDTTLSPTDVQGGQPVAAPAPPSAASASAMARTSTALGAPDYAAMAGFLAGRPAKDAAAESSRRDWNAALEMMQEAFEAVRVAEQQNQRLEAAAVDTRRQYEAHLRRCEEQISQLEARADAAERRAQEAEGWLERFHKAIVDGFTPRSQGSAPR